MLLVLTHKPDVAPNCNRGGVGRSTVGVVLLVWGWEGWGVRGGTDYAENHFQRICVLMLTVFLWRPLC